MDRKKLGERVRFLRKASGMSQKELGERAAINYKYIGEIERGTKNPSFEVMLKISKALKVEITDLLTSEGDAENKDLKRDLLNLISTFDHAQLMTALRVLKAIFR
ncbi:MAG: helix-turn-helix transcriptional regulator [Deltaproteobacteria bacterium]|nr:helix-turn-helix transcriptional regulator [Deltaproteobacteria bacterium]